MSASRLCGVVVFWLTALGFLLISGMIHVTDSYPFGAGLSACVTLIPGHAKEPQPMDTLPFMIEPEAEYFTVGKIFKVRIKTISGKFKNRKIGGFFLQARAPGTTEPVGRWEVHHEESVKFGVKGQNCSYPFDSVTHSDSKPKTADLVVHFMPTQNTPDQLQFMGTIARDYGTFWANVKSTIVTKRFQASSQQDPEPEVTRVPTTTVATTARPAKSHSKHVQDVIGHPSATPSHAPKSQRVHHVTQHVLDHSPHTTARPHRVTHHHAARRTTQVKTTPTTTTPLSVESVGKGGHHQKVDPNEKYLSEKEAAELLLKNELDTMKTRGGHRDDETDDVQNDGSTNPDSQASAAKKLGRSNSAAATSTRRSQSGGLLITGLISQLTFFISCWFLRR